MPWGAFKVGLPRGLQDHIAGDLVPADATYSIKFVCHILITVGFASVSAGVQSARWSPSGRHILIVADFQIRMTIWSLEESSSVYVTGPKFPERGCAFSPNGQLLAVAEVGSGQTGLGSVWGPTDVKSPVGLVLGGSGSQVESLGISFYSPGRHTAMSLTRLKYSPAWRSRAVPAADNAPAHTWQLGALAEVSQA